MIRWERCMDIFALRRQGLAFRAIARKVGMHRNTVKKYIEEGEPSQYRKGKPRESILASYYQLIDDWLAEDSYRATWIYHKIKNLGYTGRYDTVKIHVSKIKARYHRQAYIRFETIPGLQGQVDWADFQTAGPDGSITTLYLFILVLGFSRAMYAEIVPACTLQAFMDAHIRAFRYLGGIPIELLFDNMRHVVIGRTEGRADFNIEFYHFAKHYGFKPVACPPYSPWVKGKVERPVDFIRETFWRGYHFRGIEHANKDLLDWLDQSANCRVHGTHRQPVNVRWQQEMSSLSECPIADYDTSLKVFRKVYKDCMISYSATRYQVPPEVIGKKILLKVKDGFIRFYDDDRLLVTHIESAEKGNWTTDPRITEQIHKYRQDHRKSPYGHPKARATTRGLVNASLFPQVFYRPLSTYDQFAQGGEAWNN